MYKKKNLLITFEGIEGSGKTYQSKKLYKKLKRLKLPAIYTREPGGCPSAEIIRKIILNGEKEKFNDLTDTLLYLASRNEHLEKKIKPAILKKKIIICDRFTDSTIAYQVYGKKVDKSLINFIHGKILNNIKPDLTFILTANSKKIDQRLKMRKKINRYDKLSKKFYKSAQNAFIKMALQNKKRYFLLDNSIDGNKNEKIIFEKFIKLIK